MKLQDLLQKRASLIDQQQALLQKAANGENVKSEFDSLQAQIDNINNSIEMLKTVEQNQKDNKGAGSSFDNGLGVLINPPKDGQKDNGGFESFGEMLHAIKYGDKKGRLEHLKSQSLADGGSGGYMVPEQFSDELLQISNAQSIIRPMATVIPAGDYPDAKMNLPALNYANGMEGGVTVGWVEEGGLKHETEAGFKNVELLPKEVAGFITVNDTLLRNAPAATNVFGQLLMTAIAKAEDIAFINGDGVGKPLGFANKLNIGRIVVKRAAANKIQTDDVANMLVNFPAEELQDACFIAHNTTIADLIKLQDASGRFIFVQGDLTKQLPATLMGIPIKLTGYNAPIGKEGDLILVNLKKYVIKDGAGIAVSMSEHVNFTSNQTVIKAFRTVDAKPWVNAPYLLPGGGVQVSPYVVLGTETAATTPVSDLAAKATGNNVALTWTAANKADSVNVLRSDDGASFVKINKQPIDVGAASYADNGLSDGTYKYKLAVAGGTNAGLSNEASVTVPSGAD